MLRGLLCARAAPQHFCCATGLQTTPFCAAPPSPSPSSALSSPMSSSYVSFLPSLTPLRYDASLQVFCGSLLLRSRHRSEPTATRQRRRQRRLLKEQQRQTQQAKGEEDKSDKGDEDEDKDDDDDDDDDDDEKRKRTRPKEGRCVWCEGRPVAAALALAVRRRGLPFLCLPSWTSRPSRFPCSPANANANANATPRRQLRPIERLLADGSRSEEERRWRWRWQ